MAADTVIEISNCKIYDHFYIQYNSKKIELNMAIISLDKKFKELLSCSNINGYVFSQEGYSYPQKDIFKIYNMLEDMLKTDDINKVKKYCNLLGEIGIYNNEILKLYNLAIEVSQSVLKLEKIEQLQAI